MKVKICGVTTREDILAAVEAGADMLGFNFYPPSARYLAPEACREILAELKQEIGAVLKRAVMVGVFVNASPNEIRDILAFCGLDLAQLSGDEDPTDLAALGDRAFKALRPADGQALQRDLARYPWRKTPPAWLLDASHPGAYGGSGVQADWDLAASLASQAPLLLAGGLNPANVAQAVHLVNPWGVDVASGVEASPGRKDARLMREFIQAARRAGLEAVG